MSETALIGLGILGAIIAIGLVAIIALLLRPRAPVADPAAEQRLTELNARLDAMGSWLQNSHAQLQQTVNSRLDAVSQNLGESMKTTTKNTAEHLQQLHARLAVIELGAKEHHRSGHDRDVTAKGVRQQTTPRGLRPGPHGSHRCRRPAAGRV